MKILDYKLNALMAKSRAIYGRRLTEKDYNALLSCTSVSELTSYLKSNSYYCETLEELPSPDISAGHLEFLIRKSESVIFSKLLRYEELFGQEMGDYFIKSREIRQILSQIRTILFGADSDGYFDSRTYTAKTDIDMYALSGATDFDELCRVLDGTPYKAIVEECLKNTANGYLGFECAFMNRFYEYEYELVKKCCGKKSGPLHLLCQRADTEFTDKVYRAKKYFSSTSDSMLRDIAPVHLTAFSEKEIKLLLSAENEKEVLSVLERTKYRDYALRIKNEDYAEKAIAQLNYEKYRHTLRFGTEPTEVMFCFIFLIENEVTNLIHIVESVKYKTDTESIKNLLIGAGD